MSLNSTKVWWIRIGKPDQEIYGEESSSKWDWLEDSFGAKNWRNNKGWSTWGGSYCKV